MNTKIHRRYVFIPAVYVLLIAVLLAVEFTGTMKIQEQFGNITLSAVLPARKDGNGRTVFQVDLEMDGFLLSFKRQEPLEFRLASGRSLYAPLSDYALLPGVIEINFGDHLQLLLHSAGDNRYRIEMNTDLEEAAELVMPYSNASPVTISAQAGLPLITIVRNSRRGNVATAIALPKESTIDLVNGAFIFRNSAAGYSDFYISRLDSSDAAPASHWFEIQYDFPRVESYDADVAGYLDRVYRGWTASRYSRTNGTWQMPDGRAGFDEKLLTAVLTEATRRGTYSEVISLLRNSTVLYQDAMSWLSAPQLGDIVNKGAQIGPADLELIGTIRTLISNDDLSVFSIPGLLSFAEGRAPSPLFQELANFAVRAKTERAHTGEVLSMLEVYLDSLEINDPLSEAFARFRPLLEDRLLSSLSLTDRGLTFLSQIERADVLAAIRAGNILRAVGSLENERLYENIGKELIGAAIALADDDGVLPAELQVDDRLITHTSGFLRPEEFYTRIAGTRYYPHRVSLSDSLGSESWAWTSSDNFEVRSDGSSSTISFEYPVGGVHHFAIRGLEPFSRISFFGIQWKSDPRFQFYRTGWLYDEPAKTLYVKITHANLREKLVISY